MNNSFRDLAQISDAPEWATTALSGYLAVEQQFKETLAHIPYCDAHKTVWSPQLASVIIESASLIDSLWKATTGREDPSITGKRTLFHHWERFGAHVATQPVAFFGTNPPPTLRPFAVWSAPDFSNPSWWDAYNSLKHDRHSNQAEAKLEHAVQSVAALFLAIIYCGQCDAAVIASNLLQPTSWNVWHTAKHLRDVESEKMAVIGSSLFAHPLGIVGATRQTVVRHWDKASPRFSLWWLDYYNANIS